MSQMQIFFFHKIISFTLEIQTENQILVKVETIWFLSGIPLQRLTPVRWKFRPLANLSTNKSTAWYCLLSCCIVIGYKISKKMKCDGTTEEKHMVSA